MKAAVVSSFDAPPRYADFPEPVTTDEQEMIVSVLAVGLHPRVRSQASGSHYTSTGVLPLVPGVDGVGRDPAGQLRYFVLDDTTLGSMAERIAIDPRRSVVLPPDCDPIAVAAAMNPAMSSWIALRQRISFTPGGDVLVLGATGNAGRIAVQVARLLGANQVIAAGRKAGLLAELPALGATSTLLLDEASSVVQNRLGPAASDLDVVLDYLWGQPAATVLTALITGRADRGKPLTWIEIGSVAGLAAPIPSAALRAAQLQMIGSGQGSVASSAILAELPGLAREISKGTFCIDVQAVSLADVERAWTDGAEARHRIVITPA
ncbi:MAG TPA: zinc-binding alcohol dehydrogenase family protein [Trebonia sp.]|nr:zinc-binding alcohol dehydrogenase family protein [Trebonia sp.]